MLTSDIWGDILRFVVEAAPRQQNNGKKFKKISKKLLTNVWQIW